MRLKYEPASEPLHISVKQLFLNFLPQCSILIDWEKTCVCSGSKRTWPPCIPFREGLAILGPERRKIGPHFFAMLTATATTRVYLGTKLNT